MKEICGINMLGNVFALKHELAARKHQRIVVVE